MDALVSILGHMSGDQEKKLMDHFDGSMPEISQEIRERIFTFENVANLNNQEMRVLIDELHDGPADSNGAQGRRRRGALQVPPQHEPERATDILGEIEALGPQRLSDIQEARDYIVDHMKRLDMEGTISIRKEKESTWSDHLPYISMVPSGAIRLYSRRTLCSISPVLSAWPFPR